MLPPNLRSSSLIIYLNFFNDHYCQVRLVISCCLETPKGHFHWVPSFCTGMVSPRQAGPAQATQSLSQPGAEPSTSESELFLRDWICL